jgi:preprotein translocase subunit YajC
MSRRRPVEPKHIHNVGDRVMNQSGWPGTIVEVTDTEAIVKFDDHEGLRRFGRDEQFLEPI